MIEMKKGLLNPELANIALLFLHNKCELLNFDKEISTTTPLLCFRQIKQDGTEVTLCPVFTKGFF